MTQRWRKTGLLLATIDGMVSVAAHAAEDRPEKPAASARPGAVGIFCASAGDLGSGESRYTAQNLNAQMPPTPNAGSELSRMPYFVRCRCR